MKSGIFYEHQLPRPRSEDSEYRLLQDSLDQIELADQLGDNYAWEVEHHFLEDIVRLTPEELKRKMAAKEAAKAATRVR